MTPAVDSKKELFSRLRGQADKLREFGVESLALFGSFSRDEATPESDIDLLVEFAPGEKSFDNFMELNFFVDDLLGRSVELLTPESLHPEFAESIANELEYVDGSDHVSEPHP